MTDLLDRPEVSLEETAPVAHPGEGHASSTHSKLNWLRAGVLGANDGIVSTAGLVIGVAAAQPSAAVLFTAGMAGLASGALSMGVGEYVSVSTQRDTERALIDQEIYELEHFPEAELEELAGLYQAKGLDAELAHRVAEQLHAHDALAAHAETELGIDHEEFTNPWHAAWASAIAFTLGALIPLLSIILLPETARISGTVIAALFALAITGYSSAALGEAPRGRALVRNVCGGALAMAITFGVGSLVGTQI